MKVNHKCSAQLSQMSPINPHPALGRPAECIMLSDSRCSRHLLAHVRTNWRTSLSSSRHELVSLSAPAPDWEPCVRDRIIQGFVGRLFLSRERHWAHKTYRRKVFSLPNLPACSYETVVLGINHVCVPSWWPQQPLADSNTAPVKWTQLWRL